MLLGPSPRVAAHGIVAALIATPAELLEDPDQRQLLTTGLGRVEFQQLVELGRPPSELRPRLNDPLVLERRLPRAQHLADRVTGYPEIPGNLLDGLALDEVLAPNPRNSLHDQHPPAIPLRIKAGSLQRPHFRGSILDADPPAQGVNFARRITTVVKDPEPRLLRLQICWQGGATEVLEVRQRPKRQDAIRYPDTFVTKIREPSRPGELHPESLTGRVGDWRAGLGRSLCSPLTRSFVCECHNISTMPRFQPPPRRTQRANFWHYAPLFASPQSLWDRKRPV